MPRTLGDFDVLVNVPDFNLDVIAKGSCSMDRIVVGKVEHHSILSDESSTSGRSVLERAGSIASNELLRVRAPRAPRLRGLGERRRYRAFTR